MSTNNPIVCRTLSSRWHNFPVRFVVKKYLLMNKYFVEKDIIKSFIKSIVITHRYIDSRPVVNINSWAPPLQKCSKKAACEHKKMLEYELENWSTNSWEYVCKSFITSKTDRVLIGVRF